MYNFFKSMHENDRAPIVICDLEHTIIYMNKAAINRYEKYGGASLLGKSLLDCHNSKSVEMIQRVVEWFKESSDNNMIYTSKSQEKDVYMVALRDENNKLIGYYEKHECRIRESAELYDFSKSLI